MTNLGRFSTGMAISRSTMPLTTMRVCAVAYGTLVKERAEGRTEYWMAAEAQSPRVRYSNVSHAT